MPFQAATAAATTGLAYATTRKIERLCDGSYALLYQSAIDTLALKQITSASGTPSFTSVAQTFAISGSGNTVGDLFVLNNGTTTSDVWLTYADNSGNTATLYVAHGTYTASGSSWSWDNTGTSISPGAFTSGFMLPTIAYTGSNLILAMRANATNFGISLTYTATKNGSTGWAALATVDGGNLGSHCYPLLRHDAANGCTLLIYSLANDTIYARALADGTTPNSTNWIAATRTALTGTVNVGAANISATLDTTNQHLHVAFMNASVSTNGQYVTATYTTTSIGTPSSVLALGTGATSAAGIAIGLDGSSPPNAYVMWGSGAIGSASDIDYVTLASPYSSASAVTNLTNASSNDNAYPHLPAQSAMASFVPLVYARAVSPWAIEYDNSLGAAVSVTLPLFRSTLTATLAGERYLAGTGVATISRSTKSQSWSGGPAGSPGIETDITSSDPLGFGWTAGIIQTYGGDTVSSRYEHDNGVDSANFTALNTSFPDGAVHWYTQNGAGNFAGSEDGPFTLTELAPTNTSYRAYYSGTFGPDSNGFNWAVYTCIYPGDPGLWFYRFDLINPTASAIALQGSDGVEIALIAGLEQASANWSPANGGYGIVGGANTSGWPATLTNVDPDYVYITPSAGSGLSLGIAAVRQKPTTSYSPAWTTPQLVYLQNSSRLKLKVQGDLSSFPGSTTSTVYLLSVMRRNLTSADAAAIAADYLAPGTPTTTAGAFASFSYDEGAYVFSVSANALSTTLDFTPTSVSVRFKPRFKVTGWTGVIPPTVQLGSTTLTANQDYRYFIDATNHVLYLQLAWDVVASGATVGQLNNAALSITSSTAQLGALSFDLAATLTGSLVAPALALPSASMGLAATLAGAVSGPAVALGAVATGALTATLAGNMTTPAVALPAVTSSGALTVTLAGPLTAPAVALAATSGDLIATLAGATNPVAALGVFTSGLTAALAGNMTTPAVALPAVATQLSATLAGSLVDAVTLGATSSALTATLAGVITPPAITLGALSSGLVATVAGTLTPPTIAVPTASSALTTTLAGSLTSPAVALPSSSAGLTATLAGTLGGSLALPAFTSGLTASAAGDVFAGIALGAFTSGLTASVAGAITPPAVTLPLSSTGLVAASLSGSPTLAVALGAQSGAFTAALAGNPTPPAITLGAQSGAFAATLTGAAATPAVALAVLTSALTASVAGAITPPAIALRSISVAIAATLAGALSTPAVALPLATGDLDATLIGDPARLVALPPVVSALVVTLTGDAETSSATITVTGVVFLPNVLLQVERSVYDAATDSTSGYQLYLSSVQAHIEPATAHDYAALPAGAMTFEYVASVASGAPIVTGDRISAITLLDGRSAWPADASATASEYYLVQHALESTSFFLPQRTLYLKRVTGGGPLY